MARHSPVRSWRARNLVTYKVSSPCLLTKSLEHDLQRRDKQQVYRDRRLYGREWDAGVS